MGYPNAEEARRWHVNHVFVSCWHMNPHESAGMWNLYTRTAESVAVRTTFARLDAQIEPFGGEPVFAGIVKYVDFSDALFDEANMLWPFVHKRIAFEHEREMRVCTVHGGDATRQIPEAEVREMPVDLNALLEGVYVHPQAAQWFRELVIELLARYGLNVKVAHSAIAVPPLY